MNEKTRQTVTQAVTQLVSALLKIVLFWIIWTKLHFGQKYFYFLPEIFQYLKFWHIVGLHIVCSEIGSLIKKLSPFNFTIGGIVNNESNIDS